MQFSSLVRVVYALLFLLSSKIVRLDSNLWWKLLVKVMNSNPSFEVINNCPLIPDPIVGNLLWLHQGGLILWLH